MPRWSGWQELLRSQVPAKCSKDKWSLVPIRADLTNARRSRRKYGPRRHGRGGREHSIGVHVVGPSREILPGSMNPELPDRAVAIPGWGARWDTSDALPGAVSSWVSPFCATTAEGDRKCRSSLRRGARRSEIPAQLAAIEGTWDTTGMRRAGQFNGATGEGPLGPRAVQCGCQAHDGWPLR